MFPGNIVSFHSVLHMAKMTINSLVYLLSSPSAVVSPVSCKQFFFVIFYGVMQFVSQKKICLVLCEKNQ